MSRWVAPASVHSDLLQGLPPVIDERTRLIVLGSFPGVASLQAGQYYAHLRNQFWPILSALWGSDLRTMPYPERLEAMQARGVGLWDVFAHCRREGSLDSAIRHAALNDLAGLKQRAPGLRAVAHNGATSARAGKAVVSLASQGVVNRALPSTSPAFAAWSFERKLSAWREFFTAHGVA